MFVFFFNIQFSYCSVEYSHWFMDCITYKVWLQATVLPVAPCGGPVWGAGAGGGRAGGACTAAAGSPRPPLH